MKGQDQKNLRLGLFAVLGVWLTGGIGFPLVDYLKVFTVAQLMVGRGLVTFGIPLFIADPQELRKTSGASFRAGIWLSLCAYLVFMGFRTWGVNPTVVVTTLCPVFNFLIAWKKGRQPTVTPLASLAVIVMGVVLALAPWEGSFVPDGFLWSLGGAVAGALFAEVLSGKPKEETDMQTSFALGVPMFVTGLILSANTGWVLILGSHRLLGLLLGFGLLVGFLNLWANAVSIRNLAPEIQTTLVQGETAAAILFAGIILGEPMTLLKWLGVSIALCGAWKLGRWLSRREAR